MSEKVRVRIELPKSLYDGIVKNPDNICNGVIYDAIRAGDVITESTVQNNWIPVSERLPEEPFGCLVTVWDTNPVTMDEFENILPYFVGWDGEQWNDEDGGLCPFEVIAWQPIPEPYKWGRKEDT